MSYIVLTRFADLQDGNRVYEAGDTFPRLGHTVSPERIAELAGSDNRIGIPLIEATHDDTERAAEAPEKADGDAGEETPAESVKPAKKAARARNKG